MREREKGREGGRREEGREGGREGELMNSRYSISPLESFVKRP